MTARILIVDDLIANIKLLQAKLTQEYYDVIVAMSGAEAINVAKKKHPDLILLDVMMPDMDGYETCKKLKADPSITYIPIVMITALDNTSENKVNGINAGADDFLTKPINDLALFARIRSLTRFKVLVDELRLRGKTSTEINALDNNIMHYANQIANGKILIIDGDKVRTEYINDVLQKFFQETVISHNIKQTTNIANLSDYDLIIIDAQFSGDGLRLCSYFRNKDETRYTPILTLFDESDDTYLITKAFDIGINDYIMTPIDKNELIARVNIQIKRKRYQDALRMHLDNNVAMSIIDPLTGCYNRRYFDIHFQNIVSESIKKDKNLSFMIIDIDHFKEVNDTLGHMIGDELLQQFKQRLESNIRVTDLLARFGGEEFVIILPDTNLREAIEVAERLKNKIAQEPFNVSTGNIFKTVSIGISEMFPNDTVKTLINTADQCLYTAKKNGRNKVAYLLENKITLIK
ncbi:PleD family two-component system response regulator [Neoehrlichia mikurensis]|uniref:diguanylate cyclase n=1 Tax=Neoehrlichia mikurensis TaxID=89586 RepID=A0A9Q9C001_9RICK|nr:PleD family two-component system response regulator [Neoehrlichia mikurensis]UTO55274.1 PleD family two-component system response regulator [Neoehrlichia mikurensis]UTO56194.1 PleD family two-component system response regulator [Neoehrlichia mikurensis]